MKKSIVNATIEVFILILLNVHVLDLIRKITTENGLQTLNFTEKNSKGLIV